MKIGGSPVIAGATGSGAGSRHRPRSSSMRYGGATILTIAAFCIAALAKHMAASETFAFLLGAVAASALHGGLGPGLFAAALTTLGAGSLLVLSRGSSIGTVTDLLPLGYFAAVALLMSAIGGAFRRRWEAADMARRQSDDAWRMADAANRARSGWLTSVSHELRTPLTAVLGYAELIQLGTRGPVSDQQVEDLTRIRKAGTYLLRLINDLMVSGKIESQVPPLELVDVRVDDALSSAVAMITPQAHAKRLHVTHLPAAGEIRVRADRVRLQQILVNLAGNAVKFTAPGGSLTLGSTLDGERVRLWVHDTGCGISSDRTADIFDPFVQGPPSHDASDHAPTDGVGLGLAISRGFARAMGGDVTVESVIGVGSTFILRLPAAPGITHAVSEALADGYMVSGPSPRIGSAACAPLGAP